VVCLHHILIYLNVIFSIYLKSYFIFSMMIRFMMLSCLNVISMKINCLHRVSFINDTILIIIHKICESLISIHTTARSYLNVIVLEVWKWTRLLVLIHISTPINTWPLFFSTRNSYLLLLRLIKLLIFVLVSLFILVKVRRISIIAITIEEIYPCFWKSREPQRYLILLIDVLLLLSIDNFAI
jgi:hypothetical protein